MTNREVVNKNTSKNKSEIDVKINTVINMNLLIRFCLWKFFLKMLFLMRGIILLWERRRVLYFWSRTGGSRLWSPWWGLWRISAKSLESAASQSSIIVGWVGDRKPCFFIFVSRARRRCLQPSPSIPHQAGLAYTILDTMVALVTSHR